MQNRLPVERDIPAELRTKEGSDIKKEDRAASNEKKRMLPQNYFLLTFLIQFFIKDSIFWSDKFL